MVLRRNSPLSHFEYRFGGRMLYALNYIEFSRIRNMSSGENSQKLRKLYSTAIDCLLTHWTRRLGNDKFAILSFIAARTLKYGKVAAPIPFPAFLEGIVSTEHERNIASGLAMSKNTLRKNLKELAEDGFLHIYFPEKVPGVIDTATRYFEIDCNKLQFLSNAGSRLMSILRQPKPKKTRSEEEGSGREIVKKPRVERVNSRLPNLGDLSNDKKYGIPKGIPSDCVADDGEAEKVAQPVRRILRSRPTPAATPTAPAPALPAPKSTGERIKALLADVTERMRASRASKAAKAGTGKPAYVKQSELQALLDTAMAKHWPSMTKSHMSGKAFGAMKNHLKRSAPDDLPAFIDWTIMHWRELGQQQAKAQLRRQQKEGPMAKTFEAFSQAPDANQLGFRLPFFLACYRNYVAGKTLGIDRDTRMQDENERLKRALRAKEQEVASARTIAAKAVERSRKPVEAEQPVAAPRKSSPETYDLGEDFEIPDWDSFNRKPTRR